MTFTKIAIVGGLAILGFLCWLAAAGVGGAREGLISLFALAVLVAGGNWLAGRGSYGGHRAPPPGPRAAEAPPEAPGAAPREPEAAPSASTASPGPAPSDDDGGT